MATDINLQSATDLLITGITSVSISDGVVSFTIPSPTLPQTIAAVSHKWLNSYNATTGLFTQTQPAYSDISGTVPPNITQDVIAHILSSVTPTLGLVMWATDINEFVIGDGTHWWYKSAYITQAKTTPNMGFYPFVDKSGYGYNYLAGLVLSECNLGSSASTKSGGLRYDIVSDSVQACIDGVWQSIAVGFISRRDNTLANRYTVDQNPPNPVGISGIWTNLTTGNSDEYPSLSGLPIVIGDRVCMGAFSAVTNVNGGGF